MSDVRNAAPRLSCPTTFVSSATAMRRCRGPRARTASGTSCMLSIAITHSNLQRNVIPFLVASSLAFRDPRVFHFKGSLGYGFVRTVKCLERECRPGISTMFFHAYLGSSARSCLHMKTICGSMCKCFEAPLWYSCRTSRTSLRSRCKSLMVFTRVLSSDSSL